MSAAKADEENVCVVPLLLLELLEVLRGAFGDRSFLQLGTIETTRHTATKFTANLVVAPSGFEINKSERAQRNERGRLTRTSRDMSAVKSRRVATCMWVKKCVLKSRPGRPSFQ